MPQSVYASQRDAHTPALESAIAAHTPGINAALIRGYLVRFERAGYVHTTQSPAAEWTAWCTDKGCLILHTQREA